MNWRRIASALEAAGATLTPYGHQLLGRQRGFRRICCACGKDMGPAGPTYTGDTHGLHEPICPEGIALGYGE